MLKVEARWRKVSTSCTAVSCLRDTRIVLNAIFSLASIYIYIGILLPPPPPPPPPPPQPFPYITHKRTHYCCQLWIISSRCFAWVHKRRLFSTTRATDRETKGFYYILYTYIVRRLNCTNRFLMRVFFYDRGNMWFYLFVFLFFPKIHESDQKTRRMLIKKKKKKRKIMKKQRGFDDEAKALYMVT